MPALKLPVQVTIAAARLVASVPEEQLAEVMSRIADRLEAASQHGDSGEGTIVFRWNRGKHREFRVNADDRIG